MKIQFLNGGLANQAFQYIFARHYELSHPGEVMFLDDSYFALHTVHNGYELEKVFGLKPHMLSECFDEEVWNFILDQRRNGKSIPQILCENEVDMYMIAETGGTYKIFNPFEGRIVDIPCNQYIKEILDAPGDVYYHGYWINKHWFHAYREQFLKEFHFPEITDAKNREYLDQIRNTNSVSLHIRRGDYVSLGAAMSPEVCKMCINQFRKDVPGKWDIFVFSDDISWCREHQQELGFEAFENITYVEGNMCGNNYVDMQLMSQCKGMILSNSAFAYLAALLNVEMKYYVNPTPREL